MWELVLLLKTENMTEHFMAYWTSGLVAGTDQKGIYTYYNISLLAPDYYRSKRLDEWLNMERVSFSSLISIFYNIIFLSLLKTANSLSTVCSELEFCSDFCHIIITGLN